MESGTVHQIIQAHKRISSGNNNNEGTSGGAVSSIVSFPWPFHHRLISIIICSWLNSWSSAAALGPAAQLTGSCGDGNGIRRFAAAAQLLDSPWFSDERLNVYRHHSVSNCLFLFLSSFEVCVCAAAM